MASIHGDEVFSMPYLSFAQLSLCSAWERFFLLTGMGGIAATKYIIERYDAIRVVAFSIHEDETYLGYILEAGASGYVCKQSAFSEVVKVIRDVANGGVHIDPFMVRKLTAPREALSIQETLVLCMGVRGITNQKMAVKLDLSVMTIETHIMEINRKLCLSSRTDWGLYAQQNIFS